MSDDLQPAYSQTLVTYIDILGFADLVKESQVDGAGVGKIVRLLTTMKSELSSGRIHKMPGDRAGKIFRSFNFSDLIVRTTRIPEGEDIGHQLELELFYLADKQLALAVEGWLVRGGISLGSLFVGDGNAIIFGPALVKAYRLESEKAVYPRIIVDAALKKAAERDGYDRGWQNHIHRSEDGEYFLDYLFGLVVVTMSPEDDDLRPQIKMHRNMIEQKILNEIAGKDERTLQKYRWLALYHNTAVRRLVEHAPEQFPDVNQYLLPETLIEFDRWRAKHFCSVEPGISSTPAENVSSVDSTSTLVTIEGTRFKLRLCFCQNACFSGRVERRKAHEKGNVPFYVRHAPRFSRNAS